LHSRELRVISVRLESYDVGRVVVEPDEESSRFEPIEERLSELGIVYQTVRRWAISSNGMTYRRRTAVHRTDGLAVRRDSARDALERS
jgi:hypothetical protein